MKFSIQEFREYHPYIRILAFLVEQKVALSSQIQQFCFPGMARSYAFKLLKDLVQIHWVKSTPTVGIIKKPVSVYSITQSGLEEFERLTGFSLEKIQILSNYPKHDIQMTDLRILFSQINECLLFFPENIIQSKIFEPDDSSISLFKSIRSDSSLLMKLPNKELWMSLEFERTSKSLSRYRERLKKWYQTEELEGVLLITENSMLKKTLIELDQSLYANQKRKILFSSLPEIKSHSEIIEFTTSSLQILKLHKNKTLKIQYPILNQNLSNLRSGLSLL